MKELYLGTEALHKTMQPLDHRHRAVLAAGAAHGDAQIVASSGAVLYHQKTEQGFEQGKKFSAGGVCKGILRHPRLQAVMGAEFGIPIGIGQKTDIKDQIGLGLPVLETKGKEGDLHRDLVD